MKSPSPRSPRKPKGQGGERREEILAAALKLFGEFGVYGVSTRQIAEAAGISQPTLYAYFATKGDIAGELHGRAFQLLTQQMNRQSEPSMDTADGFADSLRPYVDFGLAHPDAYRIAFMLEGSIEWKESRKDLTLPAHTCYGILENRIIDLHARGLTVDVDPETLSQNIWAGMHGLVSLLIARPGFPWSELEHLIESHLQMLARGVLRST